MAAPLKVNVVAKQLLWRAGCVFPKIHTGFCTRAISTSGQENALANQFRQAKEYQGRTLCRTQESNPAIHNSAHEGLFYPIPSEHMQQWLSKAFHKTHYRLMKAFTESCVMVRKPALEILKCMNATSYELPVVRYLLYGHLGNGKSTSLGHIMHYCGTQDWLILHVPWAAAWNRYSREILVSSYKPGRYDLPIDAAEWLSYFRKMNEPLLKQLNLQTLNKYVWSKREITDVGAPLFEAIDFGLSRGKYASDVVGAVLKEIRLQAAQKGFRVLVAVDGVNAFWDGTKHRREEDKSWIEAEYLTLVHNFKKMLRNDWCGGAVVCTADVSAGAHYTQKSVYLPKFLLHKEGFEWLDPFLPIHVPEYSDKEAYSCLEYFTDRCWIQNPEGLTDEGKKEIIFLSCKNPLEMYTVTRDW